MQHNIGDDGLTHLDADGRAKMVYVGDKDQTKREAIARAVLFMQEDTLKRIQTGGVTKGDVLSIAQVAAIMGAKRTSDTIPLCHPLPLTGVDVHFCFTDAHHLQIDVTVRTTGCTGVEMEALCGASAGALTVYDMCKAIDRSMSVRFLGLMEKKGGKSGHFVRAEVGDE
ncbi:MAG: cyclic pyranopterin monophosphate synthase MoaC [Firmicutes bacterium]|nr:cyclic pyranopterin monophosphate synthase MoaC [Bacillota bacterium]